MEGSSHKYQSRPTVHDWIKKQIFTDYDLNSAAILLYYNYIIFLDYKKLWFSTSSKLFVNQMMTQLNIPSFLCWAML